MSNRIFKAFNSFSGKARQSLEWPQKVLNDRLGGKQNMGSTGRTLPPCPRVAVIGAGASGLTAAKYLKAEGCFEVIDVYEQRFEPGGLWNNTPHAVNGDGYWKVPQTDPHVKVENAVPAGGPDGTVGTNDSAAEKEKPVFVSPIYDTLETNIPKQIMRFSNLEFPEDLRLFPSHESVLEYLQIYAKDVQDVVRYGQQVTRVHLEKAATEDEPPIWKVETIDLLSKKAASKTYNAVIVASGHFSVPHIPEIPGLTEWSRRYPETITHSKYFRNSEMYRNKKVIVVGSSASGLDIAAHLVNDVKQPIILSQKSVSYLVQGFVDDPSIQKTSRIKEFLPDAQKILMEDGTEFTGVDYVLFCTGYLYSIPFLDEENLVPKPVGEGSMIHGTYAHLIFASNPTLSFLGLPQKVIPFPVSETQAAVVARLYAGRLTLPNLEEMRAWEKDIISDQGIEKFHLLHFPKDADYMDWLLNWARQSSPCKDREDILPKGWGQWERWVRERFPLIRGTFVSLGEGRLFVKTIEELGFVPDSSNEK